MARKIWFEYFPGIISYEQTKYMVEKFQSYNAIKQQIEKSHYLYYALKSENDTPVGFCAIRPEEKKLFLSKLYVAQQYRGMGFGGKMLDFVFEMAHKIVLQKVYLTVNRKNTASVKIYKKKKFNIAYEQKADIGSGYYMDDFVMEKIIKTLE